MYIPVFETSCFLKNQIKGARQNVSYHPRWICQEWRATFLIKLQKLECFWDWKRRVWKRIRKIRKFQSVWKSQEKVSFNIASEASYIYILSGQKFINNAKISPLVFLKLEACGQTVLPDRSLLIDKNWWKMSKLKNSNETCWVIFKYCVVPQMMFAFWWYTWPTYFFQVLNF